MWGLEEHLFKIKILLCQPELLVVSTIRKQFVIGFFQVLFFYFSDYIIALRFPDGFLPKVLIKSNMAELL